MDNNGGNMHHLHGPFTYMNVIDALERLGLDTAMALDLREETLHEYVLATDSLQLMYADDTRTFTILTWSS